jgi:hypothetical protein
MRFATATSAGMRVLRLRVLCRLTRRLMLLGRHMLLRHRMWLHWVWLHWVWLHWLVLLWRRALPHRM